jgi:hypothetical protein
MILGSYDVRLDADRGQPAPGGILLAVGAAPGGIEEAAGYLRTHPQARVCACNAAIVRWPLAMEFAASAHARFLALDTPDGHAGPWLDCRARHGLAAPERVVSTRSEVGVDMVMHCAFPLASSAMLMVLLGRMLRCERVVLAGVDLSAPGYRAAFFDRWRIALRDGLLDTVRCLTPGPVQDLVGGI